MANEDEIASTTAIQLDAGIVYVLIIGINGSLKPSGLDSQPYGKWQLLVLPHNKSHDSSKGWHFMKISIKIQPYMDERII